MKYLYLFTRKVSGSLRNLKRKVSDKSLKAYCLHRGAQFADIQSTRLGGVINLAPDSEVKIGSNFVVNSSPSMSFDNGYCAKIVVGSKAKLSIGDYSGISNTLIYCKNSITIGDHVNIGGGCMIMDSNFHSTDWRDRADRSQDVKNARTAPIVIGDYAFIGARSIICKGVTIGEKSMIAAGSVVVKDIPANCIAGGNPCKVIKMLEDNNLH